MKIIQKVNERYHLFQLLLHLTFYFYICAAFVVMIVRLGFPSSHLLDNVIEKALCVSHSYTPHSFRSVSNFLILLWLTPNDFARYYYYYYYFIII